MVTAAPAPALPPDPGSSARAFQIERGFRIEDDIHRRVCLLAGLMSLGAIAPASAVLQVPLVVPIASAAFGIVLLWFYWEARQGRSHARLAYVLTLLVVGGCWFPSSGTHGSALLYQGVVLVYAMVVLRGRTRVAGVLALITLTVTMMSVEYVYPTLLWPFSSDVARMLQLAAGCVLGSGLTTLTLGAVVTAYDRDRESLTISVAELHASRQQLAESRATLAALVNSAPDMVWLVDAHSFALTQFNEAFSAYCRRHLGVLPAIGVPLPIASPSSDAATWADCYRRALAEGIVTYEHATTGGQTLLLSFSPVGHDGAVFGVSVFSHDITDMRAQESKRADMERQLLQSQKMESLGRLAGGVAHDFNNMLTAILGQAEYLQAIETDAQKRECLAAVEHAAQRSADLTRKLLAFGRRGKNVVEAVSVQTVVRDCVVMLGPSLRPNVRLDLDLRDTWSVDGDPSQLSQVVLNLCLNANDAMPDGGGLGLQTRDVAVEETDGTRREFVELRVSDSGVGMTDEVKSRIFEPFFSTKPGSVVSGTGLGLATVDGVVHLHGGTVRVDSAPQAGSTFTVRLPRGHMLRTPPAPAVTRTMAGGRILVADDEPLVRNVATTALDRLGFQSVVATDGAEAVRLFTVHRASLVGVLLDLKMPRMGGSEAFELMHDIDPGVPIVICSGYGDNEEVEHLVRRGARGLLRKPFTLKDFSDALARLRE